MDKLALRNYHLPIRASERIQRRIERLLDQLEDASDQRDWRKARQFAEDVLVLEPDNADAKAYVLAAERALTNPDQEETIEAEEPLSDSNEGLPSNVVPDDVLSRISQAGERFPDKCPFPGRYQATIVAQVAVHRWQLQQLVG